MIAAVGARNIGDVPECVAARRVLQRTAAQGIGKTERVLFARSPVLGSVVGILLDPLSTLEESRVHRAKSILFLLGPFGLEVGIVDGIQQARAVDADGRFQTEVHFICGERAAVGGLQVHVIRRLRNAHFGINQLVGFSVLKFVAPFIGMVLPRNLYLRRIHRCLERRYGKVLRHAGERGNVVVFVVVNHQQITVAYFVGIERAFLPLAVPVTGVARNTGIAQVKRPQSPACRTLGALREYFFKQGFPIQERH